MKTVNQWSEYLGRTQESQVVISSGHIKGLAALLDYPKPPWPDGEVPPTGHWCTLFPYTQQSVLGKDGHEKLGEFIPTMRFPRRMWAGGRVEYFHTLRIERPLTRRSIIKRIEDKAGSSGPMTIVTVCHEYLDSGKLMIRDEQDIIYRDASAEAIKKPVVKTDQGSDSMQQTDWSSTILPDTSLLFRYSAITFNAHRIHYDLDYAHKEGYPDILVHAPLTATFLIDLFQRSNPGVVIQKLNYVARSPMYCGYPISIKGQKQENGRISLWAEDCEGTRSMTAELETDMQGTGE